MIPAYLNDLHLGQVLRAYTTTIDHYLLESTKDEHIVDAEAAKISGFVTPTFGQQEEMADKYFEVKNPSGNPYCLMQIDNGVIAASAATKRCDCAIINDAIMSFVEFKANATSIKQKKIKKNYKYAMKQLQTTIDIFKSRLAALGFTVTKLRTIDAFVCFRRGYPRLTTSEMNYQVDFANKTNGIPLSFNPMKTL